ncbi:hypothetical protein OIV83_005829 [Microbotryomycetes sp. JL201]|nr:hypothetical protein OIV83_005829 [Microbotryomycetes sp. JL201]
MTPADSDRRSSRVFDLAGRFESSVNISRIDAQQQTVSADLEHLTMAKRVNGLRLRSLAQDIQAATRELECSIQDVQTLLFEIQELRHSGQLCSRESRSTTPSHQVSEPSLSSSQGSLSPSLSSTAESVSTRATTAASQDRSPLEGAVNRLKYKAELINQAKCLVEIDVRALDQLADGSRGNAQALKAWTEVRASWTEVRSEIETLYTELNEDRWLTMFRTVASQADDMLHSLESVLAQCDDTLESAGPDTETVVKGLQSKIQSYAPACERVIRILAKNIADRSTTNGEALRTYSDAKLRWDKLRRRIASQNAQPDAPIQQTPSCASSSQRSSQGSPINSPSKDGSAARSRAYSHSRSAASPEKPRWNASKIRTDASRSSGRSSALGHRRPSSRPSISLDASYGDHRPVSPAFSDASSTVSRDRPSTPSKIPLPSSSRRQSITPSALGSDTISLMQRALSPTPTSRRVSVGPLRSRQSLGSSVNSLRLTGPGPSITSVMSRSRTPEPRRASDKTRPPPVPALPLSYRSDNQSTPRSVSASAIMPASSRRQSLLPTPQPSSRRRSVSPMPPPLPKLDLGMQNDGMYTANPADPLDKHVADIVNSDGAFGQIDTVRLDAPFTIAQVAMLELLSAKYLFRPRSNSSQGDFKPVLCKLVDRVGRAAVKGEKKVLIRTATGWQDLDQFVATIVTSASTPPQTQSARNAQSHDEFETF